MVKDIEKSISFFNDKWKAIELIGEGSYGKVYKAVKEEFGVKAYSAIKQIEIPYNKSEINTLRTEGMTEVDIGQYFEKSVKQWIEEIEVLLIPEIKECENIVNIEDYEVVKKQKEIGWTINIRMEELTSLDKYELDHKFTDKDILKIGIDVASALEVCENKNIVHRDIKPENIFVNGRGVYKVGDFGVAKHVDKTISNMSKKGTENYMAPELYQKKRGNKTVDIYSLGIMLYRYFNYNRLPFLPDYPEKITPNDREEAIYKRISGEEKMPPPINASRDIAEIILKACNYYPKDRYQSAKELKSELLNVYNNISNPKAFTNIKSENDNDIEDENNGTISIYSEIDRKNKNANQDDEKHNESGNKDNKEESYPKHITQDSVILKKRDVGKVQDKDRNEDKYDNKIKDNNINGDKANNQTKDKDKNGDKDILIIACVLGVILCIGDSHKSIPAIIYNFLSVILVIETTYYLHKYIFKKIKKEYSDKGKGIVGFIIFMIVVYFFIFLSDHIGIWKWIIKNFET